MGCSAGPARARALMQLALIRGYDDDLRAAEALLREAIEHADGDAELLAEAHNHLAGMLFRLRERLREAVEHGTVAARSKRLEIETEALGMRLLAEAALGDPAAPSTLRRVLELDERCRHRRVIARPLFQVAFAWLWWDELDRAPRPSRPCARRPPSSATRAPWPTCSSWAPRSRWCAATW